MAAVDQVKMNFSRGVKNRTMQRLVWYEWNVETHQLTERWWSGHEQYGWEDEGWDRAAALVLRRPLHWIFAQDRAAVMMFALLDWEEQIILRIGLCTLGVRTRRLPALDETVLLLLLQRGVNNRLVGFEQYHNAGRLNPSDCTISEWGKQESPSPLHPSLLSPPFWRIATHYNLHCYCCLPV